ncbi:MAG: hypothetical protein EOM20_03985 [Spartobacteria bacterium]|nr:hypothetical protein [Spartobacteria bacterium]
MKIVEQLARRVRDEVHTLLNSPSARDAGMPGHTFFLANGDILCLPRDEGDSRYPYGHNGFNFWAHSSGYMYSNEGLFSIFSRATNGQEPRIAFFAIPTPEDESPALPISLLSVPVMTEPEQMDIRRYTVFTPSSALYFTDAGLLQFTLQTLVTENKELSFSLHVRNTAKLTATFSTSAYLNPFLRHQLFETGEDIWFREIHCTDAPDPAMLPVFKLLVNEDKSRTESFTNVGILRRRANCPEGAVLTGQEATTSRNEYVGGVRSGLHTPKALMDGTFKKAQAVTAFTETAIMGDLLHWELAPGASAGVDLVFTTHTDMREADATAQEVLAPDTLDRAAERLARQEELKQNGLHLQVTSSTDPRIRPHVFTAFFAHLKKQVEFCSLIKGYIQLSSMSLIGVRDVFQAIEGLLYWQPAAAREKMLEALGFTAPDGRCFRQYSLPVNGKPGHMDLRPFIDQGVWVISTVWTYLQVTQDWEFLQEVIGYHVIVDEKNGGVEESAERDSVLAHLIRIMDFLLAHRDLPCEDDPEAPGTGCVRAMFGDWNDALDGLGVSADPAREYGSGVSVMATLQVYQNTLEMARMLSRVDSAGYRDGIAACATAAKELEEALLKFALVTNERGEQRILHGWGDRRAYLVGSFDDTDHQARDGLTSNAFWVLSGMLAKYPEQQDTILRAFERLDDKYGYKTFEPPFAPNTPGVGRIPKLPAGTAENAGAYIHATSFAIMALFQMGRPREAWEQLIKILPFTDIHEHLSLSPFVMPNSYGYNPEKNIDGENMNDWQTGSSNVALKLLIRYVFGVEAGMDGVWIQPAARSPLAHFTFTLPLQGCVLTVHYTRGNDGPRQFTVNGEAHPATYDATMNLDKLWIPHETLSTTPNLKITVTD